MKNSVLSLSFCSGVRVRASELVLLEKTLLFGAHGAHGAVFWDCLLVCDNRCSNMHVEFEEEHFFFYIPILDVPVPAICIVL